jgi:hypothetical protein
MQGITKALAAYPRSGSFSTSTGMRSSARAVTVYKAVTEVDGEKTAQVLLVVGSDAGGQEHPKWRENLKLAMRIQEELNGPLPTLARPMTLRTSRFNQQATDREPSRGDRLQRKHAHRGIARRALFRNGLAAVLEDIQT